jgi:hypothetical protein
VSLLLLLVARASACPNVPEAWNRALDATVAADADGVAAARTATEAGFACQVLTPPELARAWVVLALAERAAGRDPGPWMRAARRLDDSLHDPRVPRSLWPTDDTSGPASVGLEPSGPAWLDGVPTTRWPVSTTEGPHLLQILAPDGTVRLARTFRLVPGEDALVETGGITGAPLPSPSVVPAEPSRPPRPRHGLRAAALAAGLGAGAFALAARSERDRLVQASDIVTLDSAHQRQVLWAASAWTLTAATATLLGADLLTPPTTPASP